MEFGKLISTGNINTKFEYRSILFIMHQPHGHMATWVHNFLKNAYLSCVAFYPLFQK